MECVPVANRGRRRSVPGIVPRLPALPGGPALPEARPASESVDRRIASGTARRFPAYRKFAYTKLACTKKPASVPPAFLRFVGKATNRPGPAGIKPPAGSACIGLELEPENQLTAARLSSSAVKSGDRAPAGSVVCIPSIGSRADRGKGIRCRRHR
jgi:hypothetical protein